MFLRCAGCGGAYFRDELDLEPYVAAKKGPSAAEVYIRLLLVSLADLERARDGLRVCPIENCGRRLRYHPFGFPPYLVVLDRCDLHGLWLDREEVDMVLEGCEQLAARG